MARKQTIPDTTPSAKTPGKRASENAGGRPAKQGRPRNVPPSEIPAQPGEAPIVAAILTDPPKPPPCDTDSKARQTNVDHARRQHGTIMAGYAKGLSMESIGLTLDPPMTGYELALAIRADAELRERLETAREHRAHHFIELAGEQGLALASTGFAKDAADVLMKVAEKIAPKHYGAKAIVEHTGHGGGPVKVEHMTPSDAYKALLG